MYSGFRGFWGVLAEGEEVEVDLSRGKIVFIRFKALPELQLHREWCARSRDSS